ncbi:MAG: Metallophosphoesterase [Pedosphaera sp.]|nr:Metallophosphoesterase [Pedosphaera sp.]
MNNNSLISRREAIRRTILFSASSLLTLRTLPALATTAPATSFADEGIDLLALGDYGSGNASQTAVAKQMATFAKRLNKPLNSVLALGDNFYGRLEMERFSRHFEDIYSRKELNCPFYACLGNHDYGPLYDSKQGRSKAQIQLDYAAQNPASRWKMPNRWYSVELPNPANPLVKIIFLDGNMSDWGLTPQEKIDQRKFLKTELQKETKAPWRWIISHYPLFTETAKRSDNERLIKEWAGNLESNNISFYLSGHDHNLQHLQVEGYQTSFIVTGAGGAGLYDVKESKRGYTEKILGFTHLHVGKKAVTVQFINSEGQCLHAFRRALDGKIQVIKNA